MKSEVRKSDGLDYYYRYPAHYEEGEKYPVILYLIGAGSRGQSAADMVDNIFMKEAEQYPDFPFFVVAPACPEKETWYDHLAELKALVRRLAQQPEIDAERIYGYGMSMGGYGIWQLAMSIPEYFAAIVPICGGGMYWNAGRLVNVPVWAHHGALDQTVLPEESQKMVDAVNKKGGNAKLTIYPDYAHNSWIPTYRNPEVFEWLLEQRNQNAKELIDLERNTEIYG